MTVWAGLVCAPDPNVRRLQSLIMQLTGAEPGNTAAGWPPSARGPLKLFELLAGVTGYPQDFLTFVALLMITDNHTDEVARVFANNRFVFNCLPSKSSELWLISSTLDTWCNLPPCDDRELQTALTTLQAEIRVEVGFAIYDRCKS